MEYYKIENENVINEDWFEIRDNKLRDEKYYLEIICKQTKKTDMIVNLLIKQIECHNTTINLLSKQVSNFEKKFLHIPKKVNKIA